MSVHYADKETRDRLGDKSMICFGARGKWLKLARRLGLDIENIETQMDEIIKIKTGGNIESHKQERTTTDDAGNDSSKVRSGESGS